jgi:hypothetical protein
MSKHLDDDTGFFEEFSDLTPSFSQFLRHHVSATLPPFRDRLLTYTVAFTILYTAFFVQAAVLFPSDPTNFLRLSLLAVCILLQTVLTSLGLVKPNAWPLLSSLMSALMLSAATLVVILDRDLSDTISDSMMTIDQLPPYLPIVVLGQLAPVMVSMKPKLYVRCNSGVLGVYFLTHLFTGRHPLTVSLETACVSLYVWLCWKRATPVYDQLIATYKLIETLDDGQDSDDQAKRVRTGLEDVLRGLKKATKDLERLAEVQCEEVSDFTRGVLRTLAEVTHKVAETDLYAAGTDQLVGIDPEDQQFIQQNYMQQPTLARQDTPKLENLRTSHRQRSIGRYDYEDLVSVLSQMGKTWNFNTFMLSNLTESRPIPVVGKFYLGRFHLVEAFSIGSSEYSNLFEAVEKEYKGNPYHNSSHAVDVLHSFMYLAQHSDLSSYFTSLEILGCVLACLAHDMGHPALTNRFLIGTKDDIALRYNDFSVLEMMHIAVLFEMMKDEEKNIVKHLSDADWQTVRKQIIEMILATDMSRHFELIGRFRALTDQGLEVLGKYETRLDVYKQTLKCADVGHAAKSVELHERWTSLICEEFFNQGDIERRLGMQISMYCDRDKTDLAKVRQT